MMELFRHSDPKTGQMAGGYMRHRPRNRQKKGRNKW